MRSLGTVVARFGVKVARGDAVNALRRHVAMRVDQAWVLIKHHLVRVADRQPVEPFDGSVRFALITVNFGTTRLLKLLLLTMCEQSAGALVRRVIIVDHGSDDDDVAFLRRLATRLPHVELVERHHLLYHAHGLRAGVRRLNVVEGDVDPADRCNVYLFCDSDVIFCSPDALGNLATTIVEADAALAGELRGNVDDPDIQASFLAVRCDAYQHPDVIPPVHHGSPTRWMQRSIAAAADLHVAEFASNHGGHIVHRGRSSVAAARRRGWRHPVSTVPTREPHFMGVADGARIWSGVEGRYTSLLAPEAEPALLDHLARHLSSGRQAEPAREDSGPPRSADLEPFDPAEPVVWSPEVLQRRTLDAVLVLRPPGEPLRLSGFGPVLWPMFEHPTAPADVIEAVAACFSVDVQTAGDGVSEFVQSLLGSGVLHRAHDEPR